MTLAQRLLVAIGILTVATTATLGFGVREAWRSTEEERFEQQFEDAVARLESELKGGVNQLPALVEPLCVHDPLIDSILVDLRRGGLSPGRRLAISQHVPQLMLAFRLDELVLLTNRGEILGAGHADGLVGKRDSALAAKLKRPSDRASLRTEAGPLAIEAHCVKEEHGVGVGVYAARHLEPLLDEIARSVGVTLTLGPHVPADDQMVKTAEVAELGGLTLVATKSRTPLTRALRRLDATIVAIGGLTFALALIVAMLLSRGLARPIVSLSRQAREVVAGDPKPVAGGGGRELRELADTFNQAIADLTAMRKRLAATERIAARREIARRVAHEIKNPLMPIRTSVETLRRLRARDDPAFDEYFDEATRTVLDEVTRISNIVTEFTRFARLPAPNPAPTDVVEVAKQIVGLHSGSGVRVELDAADCPEVNADRDQLVQVLTNLLQNAIDAAREAKNPEVRVQVAPRGAADVAIVVRDNGPGVAPEMADRLFEPYATTKPEGTGLGLAIAQRIVVEHGGELSYRTPSRGGAEFSVVLPISGPTLLPEAPVSSRG